MKFVVTLAALTFAATLVVAQEKAEPPKPPTLSEVQRLQLQNAAQTLEIWKLRAEQATSEFAKAREGFNKLIVTMTPVGYVITDQLELIPDPKAVAAKPEEVKPKVEDAKPKGDPR